MKDYKDWGLKQRRFSECNYNALWGNLKTVRLGEGKASALPADECEFYDVSLGNKCQTGKCNFCYVSSNPEGKYYEGICETWKKWMDTFWEVKVGNLTRTNKPFQIAIGSEGSADEHPEFVNFLKTVYETNVVPNYTTNGVILSKFDDPTSKWYKQANDIIEATRLYVGGVAVSFGNKALRKYAEKAVKVLIEKCNTNVNIHHIISDKESVDEFVSEWLNYGNDILYHVLLPLMPAGRSTKGIEDGVFEYLEEVIEKNNIKNVAFGAHFIKNLRESKIKTWLYDEESFSKNIILEKDCIKITPSSFDLNPIKIIKL